MQMFKLDKNKFIDKHEITKSYIVLSSEHHSEEWNSKQDAAIGEYVQELEQSDPQIDDCYKLLQDFIVSNIYGKQGLNILDVGCGINNNFPSYVSILENDHYINNNVYIGLDPLNYNVKNRKYPFVCGRIEDLADSLDAKFDVFILASCLDHFENIDSVVDSVKKLAKPNALCLVWIGLHDTPIIAEQIGAQKFPSLYKSLHLFSFIQALISFNLDCIRNYFYFKKREKKLQKSIALDPFHFHYFTQSTIKEHLVKFGKIIDSRRVLGTNGFFYTINIQQI